MNRQISQLIVIFYTQIVFKAGFFKPEPPTTQVFRHNQSQKTNFSKHVIVEFFREKLTNW